MPSAAPGHQSPAATQIGDQLGIVLWWLLLGPSGQPGKGQPCALSAGTASSRNTAFRLGEGIIPHLSALTTWSEFSRTWRRCPSWWESRRQGLNWHEAFRLHIRVNFLPTKAARHWERLSRDAVQAPSLQRLKTQLDKALNYLIFAQRWPSFEQEIGLKSSYGSSQLELSNESILWYKNSS